MEEEKKEEEKKEEEKQWGDTRMLMHRGKHMREDKEKAPSVS